MLETMMNTVRVVVYGEEGQWIAQCLEHDICVQGRDHKTLEKRLQNTLWLELAYAKRIGKTGLDHLPTAPKHFHEMWKEAQGGGYTKQSSDAASQLQVEYALAA